MTIEEENRLGAAEAKAFALALDLQTAKQRIDQLERELDDLRGADALVDKLTGYLEASQSKVAQLERELAEARKQLKRTDWFQFAMNLRDRLTAAEARLAAVEKACDDDWGYGNLKERIRAALSAPVEAKHPDDAKQFWRERAPAEQLRPTLEEAESIPITEWVETAPEKAAGLAAPAELKEPLEYDRRTGLGYPPGFVKP